MPDDFCQIIVEDFLRNSWASVKTLVEALQKFKPEKRNPVTFFKFQNDKRINQTFDGKPLLPSWFGRVHKSAADGGGSTGHNRRATSGSLRKLLLRERVTSTRPSDVAQLCELLKETH